MSSNVTNIKLKLVIPRDKLRTSKGVNIPSNVVLRKAVMFQSTAAFIYI